MFFIIGGKSDLDQRIAAGWPPDVFQYSFDPKFLLEGRNIYLNVIEDFIVRVDLSKDLAELIDVIFNDNQPGFPDRVRVFELLSQPSRIKLSVTRDRDEASRRRKHFLNHFGLTEAEMTRRQ